jgi:hypothetical protein
MTQDTRLDPELALTFYAVFRRFENAIKKAGYSNAGRPDWEAFLHEIQARFDPQATPELYGALLCMVDKYGKRIRGGTVDSATRDLRSLSAVIREIGDGLSRDMTHRRYTSDDDDTFIFCMVILDAWSELEPNVKRILSDIK